MIDADLRRAIEAEVNPVRQELAVLKCTLKRVIDAVSGLSPDCTLAALLGAQARKLASKNPREQREIREELRIG